MLWTRGWACAYRVPNFLRDEDRRCTLIRHAFSRRDENICRLPTVWGYGSLTSPYHHQQQHAAKCPIPLRVWAQHLFCSLSQKKKGKKKNFFAKLVLLHMLEERNAMPPIDWLETAKRRFAAAVSGEPSIFPAAARRRIALIGTLRSMGRSTPEAHKWPWATHATHWSMDDPVQRNMGRAKHSLVQMPKG